MPAQITGQTDPYRAANGHTMVAPISTTRDGSRMTIWAWAECTPDCAACGYGSTPEDYAGERWDDD